MLDLEVSVLEKGVCALAAGVLGVVAAQTYPPFLALLIAVGVPPALLAIWRGGLLAYGFHCVRGDLLCGGAMICWKACGLTSIESKTAASQLSRSIQRSGLGRSFRTEAEPTQGLSYSGIQAVFWWVLPSLCCTVEIGGGWIVEHRCCGLRTLSLGPCPRQTPLEDMTASWLPLFKQMAEPVWCQASFA